LPTAEEFPALVLSNRRFRELYGLPESSCRPGTPGRSLEIPVLAEGLETESQLAVLRGSRAAS
jgi:hypothetical protein